MSALYVSGPSLSLMPHLMKYYLCLCVYPNTPSARSSSPEDPCNTLHAIMSLSPDIFQCGEVVRDLKPLEKIGISFFPFYLFTLSF